MEDYLYDERNRLTQKSVKNNTINSPTNPYLQEAAPEAITTYQYDLQGSLLKEQSTDFCKQYLYNDFHQCIQTFVYRGREEEAERIVQENLYDGEGLRFAIIENGNDIYAIRDSAIYELIYSSALRVSELVNLKIGDYYPEENLVRIVSSKRGKTRIVPVGSKAIQKIDEYLLSSRPKLQNANISDALFLSRFGRPLTRLEVWKRLDEYGERLGTHFTVHSLRHSFATHMLQNGASIVAIRDLLGHSDLRTTEVYTHLSNEDLRASFFKYKK